MKGNTKRGRKEIKRSRNKEKGNEEVKGIEKE